MLDRIERGEVPKKHHIAFRDAEGNLRYEECITREGFDGPYTIVYHQQRPHTHVPVEAEHGWRLPRSAGDGTLRKRHYKTFELPASGQAPVDARVPLLFNDDVVLSVLKPGAPDPVYFVNGDGDDLYYVFQGGGRLVSLLGELRFEADDYVYVPKGIPHRFVPDEGVEQYWLSIEGLGGFHVPKQWRNETGQLKMDAPFSHRDFRRPTFEGPKDEGIRRVLVKRGTGGGAAGGGFHAYELDHSPLDLVGWDGSVYPFVFPILNFQPRAGQVHLPPTWHGTFGARGALVCSFVPRVVDFHPEAVPSPYPHASVDVDEFIFYAKGNFTSRRGVSPGSVSYHPAGLPHGPHPGAYEGSIGVRETNELAVMLDCFKPLTPTPQAVEIEDPGYQLSFLED